MLASSTASCDFVIDRAKRFSGIEVGFRVSTASALPATSGGCGIRLAVSSMAVCKLDR